jgi:uncharacterized protein
MRDGVRVFDSDIHVIEPFELWADHLAPEFRDRAPQRPPQGSAAWLVMDGRGLPAGADHPDRQRDLTTRYLSEEILARFAARGDQEMTELATGTTPPTMLGAMDREGVDVSVVFRTQAAHVIAFDDQDPALSGALCRAYNRWLADFCSADPQRLLAGAMVPLQDPAVAVQEARFAVEQLGARALVLPSHRVGSRAFSDPAYDDLWATAADLDVAVTFHGIQSAYCDGMLGSRYPGNPSLGHAAGHALECMLALGDILTGGAAGRFPQVRFAFLEGNCSWLPWWLHALDERWEKWGDPDAPGGDLRPSELFARQCWVSAEVDEPFLGAVVDVVGADNLVVSTDWPHDDSAYPEAITTFLSHGLDPAAERRILWDNCARLYGIVD